MRNFQGKTGRNFCEWKISTFFNFMNDVARYEYYKDFCKNDFIRKSLRNAFICCSFKGCEKKANIIYGLTTWYCVHHALIIVKVKGFVDSLGGQK